jgi:PAS domain S-box-containing protein
MLGREEPVSKETFNDLRRQAEERLAGREHQIERLERGELAKIAHELAVHQVELEIQNEELRQARTAAENVRDQYLDLYDFAPVGYFTLDEHSRVVEANLTGCRLLQVDRRKLLNKHFTKFITEDETDSFYLRRKEALENENRQTLELKMQKADGTSFDSQIISVKAGQGRLRIAVIDITERKRAEEMLRSEENFRRSLDDSPLGICIVNSDGETTYANRAMLDIYGYASIEELKATPVKKCYTPESFAEHQVRKEKRLRGEYVPSNYEVSIVRKDGEIRHLEVSRKEVLWDGNAQFQVLYRDVTERKLAGKKMRELYETEQRQRQELEEEAKARGLFIDVLAHELRTPLTPIVASISMLRDILASKPQSIEQKLVNNAMSGVQTLVSRLGELLDLARFSRGVVALERQPLNVMEFLKTVAFRFEPQVQEWGQKLIFDLPPTLPQIEVDPSRLEQVLMNLLSNASKFSEKGCEIILRAAARKGELVIEVEDKGIGMTPEEQGRLFKPYHRVEQDRQRFPGLGLGLAVSKKIVEAYGGKMWLRSERGRGSTFSFSMPVRT